MEGSQPLRAKFGFGRNGICLHDDFPFIANFEGSVDFSSKSQIIYPPFRLSNLPTPLSPQPLKWCVKRGVIEK